MYIKLVDYILVYVGHVDIHPNLNEVNDVRFVSQSELKTMLETRLFFFFIIKHCFMLVLLKHVICV